jgi:hypothetical protein
MEGELKEIFNQPKEIGSLQNKKEMEGEPKEAISYSSKLIGSPNFLFNIYIVEEPSLKAKGTLLFQGQMGLILVQKQGHHLSKHNTQR